MKLNPKALGVTAAGCALATAVLFGMWTNNENQKESRLSALDDELRQVTAEVEELRVTHSAVMSTEADLTSKHPTADVVARTQQIAQSLCDVYNLREDCIYDAGSANSAFDNNTMNFSASYSAKDLKSWDIGAASFEDYTVKDLSKDTVVFDGETYHKVLVINKDTLSDAYGFMLWSLNPYDNSINVELPVISAVDVNKYWDDVMWLEYGDPDDYEEDPSGCLYEQDDNGNWVCIRHGD